MTSYRQTVGRVELISLTDGQGGSSPSGVFPSSDMETWLGEYAELVDGEGLIHPRYGSVAIRSRGKLELVDTGDGPPDGSLLDDMRSKGVAESEVDLVVLTHLHADHVGWNVIEGRPTFPNARYLVPKSDWEYWTRPDVAPDAPDLKDQVAPLYDLDIADLIEGEYAITSEVTALPTPGHTPAISPSPSPRRGSSDSCSGTWPTALPRCITPTGAPPSTSARHCPVRRAIGFWTGWRRRGRWYRPAIPLTLVSEGSSASRGGGTGRGRSGMKWVLLTRVVSPVLCRTTRAARRSPGASMAVVLLTFLAAAGCGGGPPPADEALREYDRGVALQRAGKLLEADKAYWNAIQLDPELATAYAARGRVFYLYEDYRPAMQHLNTAVMLDPDLGHAYNTRGMVYVAAEDFENALLNFTKAVQLDPGLSEAFYSRAKLHLRNKNAGGALDDLGAVIELEPDVPRFYMDRATLYASMGDSEMAAVDLERVLRLTEEEEVVFRAKQLLSEVRGTANP